MFPDRATLYVVAIEDRQYKDFKIHCEYSLTHTHTHTNCQESTGTVSNDHLILYHLFLVLQCGLISVSF